MVKRFFKKYSENQNAYYIDFLYRKYDTDKMRMNKWTTPTLMSARMVVCV